jgi:hypothetical protein
MKEPFLFIFAVAFVVFPWLPKTLMRGRGGRPWENQLLARMGFSAIGAALLVLWYSLR